MLVVDSAVSSPPAIDPGLECAIFGGSSAFLGPWGNPSRSFNNGIAFLSGCRRKACTVVTDRHLRRATYAGPTLVLSFLGPAQIVSVVGLARVERPVRKLSQITESVVTASEKRVPTPA